MPEKPRVFKTLDYQLTEKRWGITISPPIRYNMYTSNVNLYVSDSVTIQKELKKVCRHFCVYPELTEKDSRLHYHGIISYPFDLVKWHRCVLPRLQKIGFVCCKDLEREIDLIGYNIYCLKSFAQTQLSLRVSEEYQAKPIMPKKNTKTRPSLTADTQLDYGIFKYFPQ